MTKKLTLNQALSSFGFGCIPLLYFVHSPVKPIIVVFLFGNGFRHSLNEQQLSKSNPLFRYCPFKSTIDPTYLELFGCRSS